MSATTFIDTQFVVALVNDRDQAHHRARALAERYIGQRLLTTDAVLLEVGSALARKFKLEAIAATEGFPTSDDVTIVRLTPRLFDEGLSLFKVHADKQWSLTDCISFIVMRSERLKDALTMDQHFVQAGFNALMRPATDA